jgi:hypothetical protein
MQSEIRPIEVPDRDTSHNQTLEYLPPSVAHKTLGHYKEHTGIQKTQFRQLKAKSDNITAFLWSTHLTREEAWIYYHSCYIPAVTYPLTSTFLSMTQLKSIQTKAMAIITAKCGFKRHTKTEVLFGPKNLGGAEFRHLSVQQGISQATYLLRHWRTQSSVGNLLKCTLAWLHLSAGMSYSLLERVDEQLPHLESKWIHSLCQFLSSISASIHLDDPCIPQPQRVNDQYLMDMIIQSNRYTPVQLRTLNYCRLYLQAVTLADITTPNGLHLDPCFLTGHSSLYRSRTRWHSVNQDRPSDKDWRLWKLANRLWSDQSGRLFHPLGAWLHPVTNSRFQHFAYQYRRSLFIRTENNEYTTFRHNGGNKYRASFSSRIRTHSQLPNRARPSEVEMTSSGLWRLHGEPSTVLRVPSVLPSATATFDLFIGTLEPWETELLQHVHLSVDPFSLCLELTPGFRAVSDGSVTTQLHGSFGWIVSSLNGDRLATGMGPALGRSPHSFRAEAYGLLSFLRFLLRIKEYTGMHDPWMGILATDGQSVLDTLQLGDHDPQEADTPVDLDKGDVVLDCLRPDWDLLIEIQSAMKSLPNVTIQ